MSFLGTGNEDLRLVNLGVFIFIFLLFTFVDFVVLYLLLFMNSVWVYRLLWMFQLAFLYSA